MNIKYNFPLAQYNTFGINVLAKKFSVIACADDLTELYKTNEFKNNKILILSGGSNVLFTNDFNGLVLLNQIIGKTIVYEDDEILKLRVSSGESWETLVEFTVNNNWGGLENLTDIPGKVGAAPVQNIGAYGVELKDVMISLEAFDMTTGNVVELLAKDCEFGYRSSIFKTTHKNKYFITSVVFKLSKKPRINISYKPLQIAFGNKSTATISVKNVSKKISEIRKSKIPSTDEYKNAGSFFKNPVVNAKKMTELLANYPSIPSYKINSDLYKIPAAWLIETCGWKGKRVGDVGTFANQALIIVNYNNATGQEIIDYASLIQKSVASKFEINIEMEVNVV